MKLLIFNTILFISAFLFSACSKTNVEPKADGIYKIHYIYGTPNYGTIDNGGTLEMPLTGGRLSAYYFNDPRIPYQGASSVEITYWLDGVQVPNKTSTQAEKDNFVAQVGLKSLSFYNSDPGFGFKTAKDYNFKSHVTYIKNGLPYDLGYVSITVRVK